MLINMPNMIMIDKVAVPPLVGALLKNEQDTSLFEKLVFMNQRNR